ncbi:MAG: glycosyl transferase [Candidatus Margulisbacteria bacterium]|nr:glycosyl transferase [Candidatus Margulisiibacteriota bacterium]
MKYGYFDDKNKEYVITNPKTPVKWVNYVGTLKFGGIVDHTGGSIICKGDPALNRIVKYIPQLPSSEFKGETLYIRIHEKNGYKVFSPFFVPTLDKYDKYECHVGLSYQKIISEFYGIQTEVTIFVPLGANVVLRDIKVTNKSGSGLKLDIIPVVEYSHFDALKQFTNADWVPQTMTVDAIKEKDGKVIHKQYAFMRRDTHANYFTSNYPVDSFETDRKNFLGDNEYGTWMDPLELHNEHLSNYQARRADNISALLHKCGTLKNGQSVRIITQLGQEETVELADPSIKKYRNEKEVDKAFNELKEYWSVYLSKQQIETPDASFNSMVNVHNPRQCHTTMNWSRDLSLYQLGFGGRGIGFRDSSQDVMGVMANMPEEAKQLIIKLLSVQRPDGSAMHQFYASTMEANEGDSREEKGHNFYCDDHLWIILSVNAYLKETGDYSFLKQQITFYDKKIKLEDREKATVLEHLKRSLHFTKTHLGQHGLPLLGFADWNDTVNLKGNAESAFAAHLYGKALLEMIELLDYLGDKKAVTSYKADYEAMKKNVDKNCWDGQWYIRYFEEDGTALGSKKCAKGKIYVNGQSWPVIAGFSPNDKANQALNSVNKLLNTKYGIKLSTPGFNGFDWRKGGITTYPPGAKENGGIFLHANPWVMIAETIMGNGNRAFQYYNQINPAAKNDIIDIFECEPYSYPQNILGDEHPQFGLGRNSWLSGTASWTYQAATKYILGILPTHFGLQIDPCIPESWDGFKVNRIYRSCSYQINIKNPKHVCRNVASVKIDGKKIKGNILPIFDDKKEHKVEVVLG